MKKDLNQRIAEAIDAVKPGDKNSVLEAARSLLDSQIDLSSGDRVAVIQDPTYPYSGLVGKVKGKSEKGSGYSEVEFANGNILTLQSDLLIKL